MVLEEYAARGTRVCFRQEVPPGFKASKLCYRPKSFLVLKKIKLSKICPKKSTKRNL